MDSTLIRCVFGLALCGINGFFVLVEFAIVKARKTQLELMKAGGMRSAAVALGMKKKIDGYLSAAQVGVTMSSLGLGWVGEPAFSRVLEPFFRFPGLWSPETGKTVASIAAFAMITFLLITVGEMPPKYIGVRLPEKSLAMVAYPMRLCYWLLFIPLTVINKSSNLIMAMLGLPTVTKEDLAMSEEELKLVLTNSHREGDMTLNRVLLFENVMDFTGLTANDIMVPLSRVAMLDVRNPWNDNLKIITSRKFSRYPLINGDQQKVIGLIHIKDLGMAALSGEAPGDLLKFAREVPRVEDSITLEDLMHFLQRRPTNLTMVTDKTGRFMGIVTFEDILEELVGEISDEFDREMPWLLGDHLDSRSVILDLAGRDSCSVIREMAELLVNRIGSKVDRNAIVQLALRREAEAPTAVGHGIALPHARVDGIHESYVAYGRAIPGLDFKAADSKPVSHIFLIVTPKERPREQLQALSRIAALVNSDVLLSQLCNAKSADEVTSLINAADLSTAMEHLEGVGEVTKTLQR